MRPNLILAALLRYFIHLAEVTVPLMVLAGLLPSQCVPDALFALGLGKIVGGLIVDRGAIRLPARTVLRSCGVCQGLLVLALWNIDPTFAPLIMFALGTLFSVARTFFRALIRNTQQQGAGDRHIQSQTIGNIFTSAGMCIATAIGSCIFIVSPSSVEWMFLAVAASVLPGLLFGVVCPATPGNEKGAATPITEASQKCTGAADARAVYLLWAVSLIVFKTWYVGFPIAIRNESSQNAWLAIVLSIQPAFFSAGQLLAMKLPFPSRRVAVLVLFASVVLQGGGVWYAVACCPWIAATGLLVFGGLAAGAGFPAAIAALSDDNLDDRQSKRIFARFGMASDIGEMVSYAMLKLPSAVDDPLGRMLPPLTLASLIMIGRSVSWKHSSKTNK